MPSMLYILLSTVYWPLNILYLPLLTLYIPLVYTVSTISPCGAPPRESREYVDFVSSNIYTYLLSCRTRCPTSSWLLQSFQSNRYLRVGISTISNSTSCSMLSGISRGGLTNSFCTEPSLVAAQFVTCFMSRTDDTFKIKAMLNSVTQNILKYPL